MDYNKNRHFSGAIPSEIAVTLSGAEVAKVYI